MKRWLCAAAVGVLGLFGAGSARAEVSEAPNPSERIFDDAGFKSSAGRAITAEITAAEKKCDFEELSREGPSPNELAACQVVIAKIVQRGPSAIGPILATLDKDETSWNVRRRLYDVLARTKDVRLIEPLIRGMARIATRKIDNRTWEMETIHETLGELTRAPIRVQAPWETEPVQSTRRRELSLVVDWRLWLDDNQGLSHAEMVARRLAEERAHVADASPERAYRAVAYLLARERKEGLAAAKKLAARIDLPSDGKDSLEWAIEQAEEAEAQAAKGNRVAAPAAKAMIPPPKVPPKVLPKVLPKKAALLDDTLS